MPVVSPGPAEEVGVRREELGGLKAGQGHQHQGQQHQGVSERGKMRVDQRTDAQQALLGK